MPDDYGVGYGKPPKASQFKKGQSGNPAGRPRKFKNPINVLQESVLMRAGGKKRQVDPFEASVRKTAQSAIEGRLPAIKRFVRHCDEAGLLVDRNKPPKSGVYRVPLNPETALGRPPTDEERALLEEANKDAGPPKHPKKKLSEKDEIVRKVATELHRIPAIGGRMSVLELVMNKLRHRALVERHEPSHAYFEKLLTRTTVDIDDPGVGYLMVTVGLPPGLSPLKIERVEEDG